MQVHARTTRIHTKAFRRHGHQRTARRNCKGEVYRLLMSQVKARYRDLAPEAGVRMRVPAGPR